MYMYFSAYLYLFLTIASQASAVVLSLRVPIMSTCIDI